MAMNIKEMLQNLGIQNSNPSYSTGNIWGDTHGSQIDSFSPVDGQKIASVAAASDEDYETVLQQAVAAAAYWKAVPAPRRGDSVRQFGDALR